MRPELVATNCTPGGNVFAAAGSVSVIGKYVSGTLITSTSDDSASANYNEAFVRCLTKGGGGFIPTNNQLQIIYNNAAILGGFSAAYYWTVTAVSSTHNAVMDFSNGSWSSGSTDGAGYRLRCVRTL